MSKTAHRRRQKLVDPKLQLGLGLHLVSWLYFYIVLFALGSNAAAMSDLVFAKIGDPAYAEAVSQLRAFGSFVVVPLTLTFVAMAVHGVFLTHRLAGPVYRVKAVLAQIAQRRFPERVTFREGDYMLDVAEAMTVTVQALREDQVRVTRMNQMTLESARAVIAAVERSAPTAELLTLSHAALDAAERLDRHVSSDADGVESVPMPEAELAVSTDAAVAAEAEASELDAPVA